MFIEEFDLNTFLADPNRDDLRYDPNSTLLRPANSVITNTNDIGAYVGR